MRLPDLLPQFSLQHVYRAMDFLEAPREAMEEQVFERTARLLELHTELLFFDTTSLRCETDEEDEQRKASSAVSGRSYPAVLRRSYSKKGFGDVSHLVTGLAGTRSGRTRAWSGAGPTRGTGGRFATCMRSATSPWLRGSRPRSRAGGQIAKRETMWVRCCAAARGASGAVPASHASRTNGLTVAASGSG